MRLFGVFFTLLACVALAQEPGGDDVTDEVPEEAEAKPTRKQLKLLNPAFPAPPEPETTVERGVKFEREDFAPYFASGTPAQAKAAFDAGRYTRAVELLEGQGDDNPVRFLRALAAFRARDFKFAAPEFEALAEAYPQLKDRCLVHAGQAYEQLKEWPAAQRVYGGVSPATRLHIDASLGLSRALRFQRDFAGAEAALAEYAARPTPPWGRNAGAEALLALADLAAARRDVKAEKAALHKLWSSHALSKEAQKVEPRLGDTSKLPADVLVARAESLIDAHRNAQGVAMLEPLAATLKVPDETACRAHFALGKGYRKLRQHAKALPELTEVKRCKDAELRMKALFTLGFSQGIVAPSLSAATYEALAAEFPTSALADDALFYAAEQRWRRDEKELAIERLIDVADGYPDGDFAADALFKLFWIARAESRFDDAAQFLSEIEGRFAHADDTAPVERARYWRGRLLESQEKVEDALTVYEAVAVDHPATYYGLLARERVEALDELRGVQLIERIVIAPAANEPFPIYAGPLVDVPQFKSAVELLRLGFGELVPMEIVSMNRAALPRESLRLLVLMLAMAGHERAAHGMARLWLRRDLTGPISADVRAWWEIAYPNAFRDLVVTHSEAADELDPDLLQALMREESALDPRALSWAGALGLCQLMPATAAEVAGWLKLPRPTQPTLLEPDLNIRLGAKYLAHLIKLQKGVKPFAVASYNAGASAVGKWRQKNGDTDLAEWVEEVPIQETRHYVKRVLRSYNTYKLLYAPGELAKTVVPPPIKGPRSG